MEESTNKNKSKAWIVTVNMGYGHQRTTFPLRHLAPQGKVINANDYNNIPKRDRKIWESSRMFYEFISKFKRAPIIGSMAFNIFNKFQEILSFYPKRDLSRPNFPTRQVFALIKRGWGKHLIEKLSRYCAEEDKYLPLITSFFTPAFMAEHFNYPGEIYCIICDADIARSWVSLNPRKSRIKYFSPNHRVVDRLKLYGIKEENIFLTGYPLPKENIGSLEMDILKSDFSHRILNLDPKGNYCRQYDVLIRKYLNYLPAKSNHILTLMFSIGGAGTQKEIAMQAVKSLSKQIKAGEIKFVLMVGIREEVKDYFLENLRILGLSNYLDRSIEIVLGENIGEYFKKFNKVLRTTDILWTKPSELSFYTALGLPIIIAPPIGSQEDYNQEWLLRHGSGIIQRDPRYTNEWLFEFLNSGLLADAAMNGFVKTEKFGTFNIEKIISNI